MKRIWDLGFGIWDRRGQSQSTGKASGTRRRAFPLPPSAFRLRAGVSLVEVVVCIPLVGLVLVGAMNTTGAIVRTWTESSGHHQGLALAEAMMAEIMQQYYEDPDGSPTFGNEGGELPVNRTNWDDVDDYESWSNGSPPRDKTHNILPGTTGWSRTMSVVFVSLSSPTTVIGTDQGLKRITVTVTDPAGETTQLVAYRSRCGAMEQPRAADATVQGFISHELGIAGSTLHGGAHLSNHAEDE